MALPDGTVTLLFTDIEGSTRLLQLLGDEYADALQQHHQIIRDAVREYEGTEVDTQGDAFFVAFGSATAALSAAISAQRGLASADWPAGASVRVRMGLLTGQPRVAGDHYVGIDVHRAARIAAAGHGGQILLSASTAELVRNHCPIRVAIRDLGYHRLKDLEQPEHVFQAEVDGLVRDFPAPKTLDSHPNNLPAQVTRLIGRELEVEALCSQLRGDTARLITLTGPGGTGKTRLALAAAGRLLDTFSAGVYLVALASVTDPDLVAPAIASALRLRQSEARRATEDIRHFIGERQILLLLDNFEQIVCAAPFLGELLAACPRLKILVTSRTVLRVSGERSFRVPPLRVPDLNSLPPPPELQENESVELFISRAVAASPDFQLTTDNARAVAEICIKLEGLPLAIELAAARVRLLPPVEVLRRLNNRLELLKGGPRDSPERHRSLRLTIAWSFELLDPEQQVAFRRMSVFAGGCSLASAESICSDPGQLDSDLLEIIAGLVDSSLVQSASDQERFSMLEIIREFAMEKLEECGESPTIQARHVQYFVDFCRETVPMLTTGQIVDGVRRFRREEDNLRAAIEFAKPVNPDAAETIENALVKYRKQLTYLLPF